MSILLTGATGAIGGELLCRLLEDRPNAAIYVLVRAHSQDDLAARVNAIRLAAGREHLGTICPIQGDITLPGLGLTP